MRKIRQGTIVVLFLSIWLYNNVLAISPVSEPHFWITTTMTDLTIDVNTTTTLKNPRMEVRLREDSINADFYHGEVIGKVIENVIRFKVSDLSPKLWHPLTPHLYHLEFNYFDGDQLLHSKTYRIGFNEFTSRNGQLFLNGKPIFLRGIAINPPGRGIPTELETSREFALEYVRYMKSLNVNIIRIPDNENWYQVCDELGMMVFGGNYSGSVDGERPPKEYDKGVQWYKEEKFYPIMHHPSLVIYALTNEVPYEGQIAQDWVRFLSYAHKKLREWDSTRLYIGNAGYGYGQSGDICDLHRYWGWYYSSPFTFLHIRDYPGITLPNKIQPLTFTECVGNYTGPDGRYNLTPNHKNPVSQLAWTGHAPQREQQLLADQHQSFVFKQVTELVRRLRRINPESSGVFPFTIMFRNWHTVERFVDMAPKPVTNQARISYQPVLLSWEHWQPQLYAGSEIAPIAHIINDSDDFSDLKDNYLVVRFLDKAFTKFYVDTIALPDIPYYKIHSEPLKIHLPDNLFTGYYNLEGIVISSGREVSRNQTEIYIEGIQPRLRTEGKIPVYDPSGRTLLALEKLKIPFQKITSEQINGSIPFLLIGCNSVDAALRSRKKEIVSILQNGGRILILDQDQNHQAQLEELLPIPLIFPKSDIDNPEYPPPPRPSSNGFNVNPTRADHPVFKGITRQELRVWSDYTGWDEDQKGLPAIYPVTHGFTLADKQDRSRVAVLANYSVGLEGIALAEIFDAKGSIIVSGFDLVQRAGIDPVADRLFMNLIAYGISVEEHELHPLIEEPIRWGEFETEKGILDGITSGFMINSKPQLYGSYENLRILLEREGHMYAGAKWGWNNRAGKQYVPYGRRIFGPYHHRGFGGVPTPIEPESPGKAFFWCRVPKNTTSMKTLVWNPADEALLVKSSINEKNIVVSRIPPGQYTWFENTIDEEEEVLRIDLEGDRRLVVLETRFD